MRLKRIQIFPIGKTRLIVAWGLGERGQTPVLGKYLVTTGTVSGALRDPSVQKTLGIKPDRRSAV